MTLPAPGRHMATAPETTVYESDGGALILASIFETEEGERITGYTTLCNRDGAVNQRGYDTAKKCYGWDGSDPTWFFDQDFSETKFSIKVEPDTNQNGDPTVRVAFIDPPGGGGSLEGKKADRKAILAKYGSKFRALSGGSPAPGKKPKPKGNMPPPPDSTPDEPPEEEYGGPEMSKADAWAEINQIHTDPEEAKEAWFALCKQVGNGKKASEFTDADWAKVVMIARQASGDGEENIPF